MSGMGETAQSRWGPGAAVPAQPSAIFVVGAAAAGTEELARALASLGSCSAIGEEPAPIADLGRDGDRREGTHGGAGARTIRSSEHVTTTVDGAPKRSLQIPRLDEVYEDARFILCGRPAPDAAAVAYEAWRSGRQVTHPDLPGWPGTPWSYALIPGWRRLIGADLGSIVAEQWSSTIEILLGDLADLRSNPPIVTSFAALATDPEAELRRLVERTGISPSGIEAAAPALAASLERIAAPAVTPPGLEAAMPRLAAASADLEPAQARLISSSD